MLTWQDLTCEVLQEWNYHLISPQRCAQKGTGVTGTSAPAAAPTPPAPSCREASLRLCGEATQGPGPAQGDAKRPYSHSSSALTPACLWSPWQPPREEKLLCIKEPRRHVRPGSAANEVVALGLQPRPLDPYAQLQACLLCSCPSGITRESRVPSQKNVPVHAQAKDRPWAGEQKQPCLGCLLT